MIRRTLRRTTVMGRSTTPTYRLEYTIPGFYISAMWWRVKAQYGRPGYGKPNNTNLAKEVHGFEESTKPGKPNAHLGELTVKSARIINQFSGEVVATYEKAA